MHQNGFLFHFDMINGINLRHNLKGLRSKLLKVLKDADLANPIDMEDMFKNIISFLLIGIVISICTIFVEIIRKLLQ